MLKGGDSLLLFQLKVTSANYFKISITDSNEPATDTSKDDFPQKAGIIFSMALHHGTISENVPKQGTSKMSVCVWGGGV